MKIFSPLKLFLKLILIFSFQQSHAKPHASTQILQLEVYKQTPNFKTPWQKNPITRSFPIAVKIKYKNKFYFVTLAQAVKDFKSIQIRTAPSEQKQVTVKWIDQEVNLAVLTISPQFNHDSIISFELAPEVALNREVRLLQAHTIKSVTVKKTIIRNIELDSSNFSAYKFVHYVTNSKEPPCRSAEALFYKQQLVGLCHKSNKNQKKFIPSFTIKNMLNDFSENATYKGFSDLGFEITEKRQILSFDHVGVLPSSLQGDDFAISFDNKKLLKRGNIEHKLWGRVNYRYYLHKKKPNEKVNLTIKQNGLSKKITLKLKKQNSNSGLVRYYRKTKTEPYILYGGLVIQRLSLELLTHWGREWRSKAPSQLLYLLNLGKSRGLKGHALMISQVFSDETTRGYDKLKYAVIHSVDNKKELKFKELKDLLQSTKNESKSSLRFKLMHGNGSIIINKKEAQEVTKRISNIYSF